ncbi:bacteriophytochrome heme oxygenase BphO [Melittangium boletus DSM 14713]|uniref:Bacteriophytochrome heme oxygenase BphO n=1 Tax=Melittangium boletus DSM 14713 TaxID=1294270 RepID=A0A250IIJ5_9BACT|nr:bacteriophytochrome heme oxygenase BphO [Melittangium boletus DSM 14713]
MLPGALLPPESRNLLQLLKAETRPHHERAESVVRLMSPDLSLEGYRRHLEALHSLHAALESVIADRLGDQHPELLLPERWKLHLLREDLLALGHDEASLARLPGLTRAPSVPGVPEALGALYVLEGSTLGGQIILRHLVRHFEGQPVGRFAFFRAYGDAVGPMWKSFGEVLLRVCPEPALAPRVVRGAQEAFELFEARFREVNG